MFTKPGRYRTRGGHEIAVKSSLDCRYYFTSDSIAGGWSQSGHYANDRGKNGDALDLIKLLLEEPATTKRKGSEMKVTTMLSMMAARASELNMARPVIRTDLVSAGVIADSIEAELGHHSPFRQRNPVNGDVVATFDGVSVMADMPKPAPTFEVGRRYRTRDGKLTGPLQRRQHHQYPLQAQIANDHDETWTLDGAANILGERPLDLMPGAISDEEAFCEGSQWTRDDVEAINRVKRGEAPNWSGPNSASHPDVINRAKHNADAPYDERTCRLYPWAAAARITFLQSQASELREERRHSDARAEHAICEGMKHIATVSELRETNKKIAQLNGELIAERHRAMADLDLEKKANLSLRIHIDTVQAALTFLRRRDQAKSDSDKTVRITIKDGAVDWEVL